VQRVPQQDPEAVLANAATVNTAQRAVWVRKLYAMELQITTSRMHQCGGGAANHFCTGSDLQDRLVGPLQVAGGPKQSPVHREPPDRLRPAGLC
jgi:hypothetical protein